MKSFRLIYTFCFILIGSSTFAQTATKSVKTPFTIGETVSFYSETLKEERKLNIYLPQNYDSNAEKKYPVIYLMDGSADEDFIHIAGLVQFCSFSWINIIPETILIGISNVDRKRDFTFPTTNEKDKKDFPTTGGSEKFIQFLEHELQPLINSSYNITEETTIIGQSLGGLIATEILLKKPRLFNNYIIVSPSMWWDDESLLNANPVSLNSPKNIYIAVGSEGPTMETGAVKLHYKLVMAYEKSGTVYYNFLKEQNHGDTLHLAVYDAFEKIFASKKEN